MKTMLIVKLHVAAVVVAAIMGGGLAAAWAATPIYTKKNAPKTPKLEQLPLKKSLSQHGITWTFDKPVRAGQFVNGDWYFVGPATVVMIDPKPLLGKEVAEKVIDKCSKQENRHPGKRARNGSLLNPAVRNEWGGATYDSRHCHYDPDLFAHLPIRMKPGDMLISSISRRNDELKRFGGYIQPVRLAVALTCLAAPQPPDAFRSSYCDTKNSKIYLARNLRRDLLASAARTPKAPASLDEYAKKYQKPWLDRVWYGRCAPKGNNPRYGSRIATLLGEGSLLLQMDYTPAEKEPLLINLVQVGIDFWGLVRQGRSWPATGGANSGRKWPIVFAGVMLDDADMQSPKKRFPKLRFGEDDQTAFCPCLYKGKVYRSGWTGAKVIFTGHSLGGRLEHGPVDLFPPAQWPGERGSTQSGAYRRQSTSPAWVAQALAARMMHVEKAWGHDAFFAYVDRWMTEDDAPFVEEIKKARGYTVPRYNWQGTVRGAFTREMWTKYRNNLPPAPDGQTTPPAEKTWTGHGSAKGTISGKVTDKVTGKPVSGATLSADDYYSGTADADGNYTIEVTADQYPYTLKVSATKYVEQARDGIKVSKDGKTVIDFALEKDKTPPAVKSHSPAGKNPAGKIISVAFSEPMSVDSTEKSFSISPSAAGTFIWRGSTMYFVPAKSLEYGTKYKITVVGAEDLAGNKLKSPHTWEFSTLGKAEHLVGEWRFEEESGDTAKDSSGRGNHGKLKGNPARVKGKVGKALSFDGEDDCVEVPHNDSLVAREEITIEAWVKTDHRVTGGGVSYGIVGKFPARGYAGYQLVSYAVRVGPGQKFLPRLNYKRVAGEMGNISSERGAGAPYDTWVFLCVTRDFHGNAAIYINGEQAATVRTDPIKGVIAGSGQPDPLWIGHAHRGRHFKGLIDDVRIYNRALSAAEIKADFERTE